MEKIKNFLKTKSTWIIIVLLVLFTMKSCQSCNRRQEISFMKQQTELTIDSLKSVISSKDSTIYSLETELSVVSAEKKASDYMIQTLSKDKSDYQKISSDLAKSAANSQKNQK